MKNAALTLDRRLDALKASRTISAAGRVRRFDGQIVHASSFPAAVGTECRIASEDGGWADAEVIGFLDDYTVMVLTGGSAPLVAGARVETKLRADLVPVGEGLLGRVFDGAGRTLDGLTEPVLNAHWPLRGERVNPLRRKPVRQSLDVGVRALNALLTVGRGQKVGIIAGSGVGKSSLLSCIARFTSADVVVIGLIGERGREVSGFVEELSASESFAHTVVVAVPADHSPVLRLRGLHRATAYAEYFRSQGKNVLLMVDSLTRVAHAQRELGLALGEHPTTKGYPPSVISLIGSALERAGLDSQSGGSITGIYTILADGDDTTNDPIVDTARAILDGHVVLSRKQAEQGIFPAIDVNASVSRTMTDCVSQAHMARARKFRRYLSLWEQNRDLMLLGGYQTGQDPELDMAFQTYPSLVSFITQGMHERSTLVESDARLQALFP
ncbi:MAG: FliI/YscN family ATPase [Beijerinckiaceae bacterium]|jgi:flagellum-specific ATP synthase